MNEFLKNLRNPQRNPKSRQSSSPRKTVESSFLPSMDRRRGKERRASQQYPLEDPTPTPQPPPGAVSDLYEPLMALAIAVETMTQNHEKLATSQMEVNRSLITFLDHLSTLLSSDRLVESDARDGNGASDPTAPPVMDGARYTKEEVVGMIQEMRKKRCTFGEIAEKLKQRNIPTFSGRGEWHAQTIHRLCRKN